MKWIKKNSKWFYLALAVWDFVDMLLATTTTTQVLYGTCWLMMSVVFGISVYTEKKEKKLQKPEK